MPAVAHLLPPPWHLNVLSQRPGLVISNSDTQPTRRVVSLGRVGRFAGDYRCSRVAASTVDVGSVVPGFGEGAEMEPLKVSAGGDCAAPDDVCAFSHVRLVWLRFRSLYFFCLVVPPVVRPRCH